MKITVIAVGKLKEKYMKEYIAEYGKRLSKFCDFEIMETQDEPVPENMSAAQADIVREKEAEKIKAKIKQGSYVIALDVQGKELSSELFADKIQSCMINGRSHIFFLIGGSIGIDHRLLSEADFRMSMSRLTFPHQLARIILCEQIFRAFKIIRNESYHK